MSDTGRTVRPATAADRDILLRWRNDPSAYPWYGSAGPVSPEEHDAWLGRRLAEPAPRLWILAEGERPLGSGRLDVDDAGVGTVSVVVDDAARRRGVAAELLSFIAQDAAADGLVRLRAEIHRDNAASLALFRAAGYHDTSVQGAFQVLERDLREAG